MEGKKEKILVQSHIDAELWLEVDEILSTLNREKVKNGEKRVFFPHAIQEGLKLFRNRENMGAK